MGKKVLSNIIYLHLRRTTSFHVTRNDTKDLQPPYLLVSNHVNNWDPLFLNIFVEEPIAFVAGEPLFRNPFLKKVLDYTGAIRKMKFKNDSGTIRNMIKAKKHNRVIGLFPEGNRNWDGVTEPIIYSTAKLVKLLKIPVVAANIKGGYLTHPRWADGDRKGRIEITFEKIWDGEAVRDLPIAMIHKQLTKALYHDEMEWQKEQGNRYKGKAIAQYLERLLFICPSCQTIGNMYSEGNQFTCTSCHYQTIYTEEGFFQENDYFATPHQWKEWQSAYLDRLSKQLNWIPDNLQESVTLYLSKEQQPFRKVMQGTLTLKPTYLHIHASDGRKEIFPFEPMDGLNIHFHHKLDFFIEDNFYRIVFSNPRSSAYMWIQFIERLNCKQLEDSS